MRNPSLTFIKQQPLESRLKIIIAGAGIGGLTAALCLLKEGHEVAIYEKTAELEEVGAGLQLGANAIHVFKWLDLETDISSYSVKPDAVDVRLFSDGRSLFKSALGQEYEQCYGAPYYHIHRADLQSVLVSRLQAWSPHAMNLGCSVSSYKELDDSVTVHLSNGQQVTADCLIGADGIKSSVRQQLFKHVRCNESLLVPRWTGYAAWRGTIDAKCLPANFMETVVSNFVGPRKHMVIYYVRNRQLVNFVGVIEQAKPSLADGLQRVSQWSTKASWQQLKSDFSGWHKTVQAVIDAVDSEQCYRWDLYDHRSTKPWSGRRVTLLGDAAHATLPFLASGAAMAIEDARILSRVLTDDVPLSLQHYQDNRIERTQKVQRLSKQLGRLYHLPNKLALKLAFSVISKQKNRPDKWLPSYNANTVVIK